MTGNTLFGRKGGPTTLYVRYFENEGLSQNSSYTINGNGVSNAYVSYELRLNQCFKTQRRIPPTHIEIGSQELGDLQKYRRSWLGLISAI